MAKIKQDKQEKKRTVKKKMVPAVTKTTKKSSGQKKEPGKPAPESLVAPRAKKSRRPAAKLFPKRSVEKAKPRVRLEKQTLANPEKEVNPVVSLSIEDSVKTTPLESKETPTVVVPPAQPVPSLGEVEVSEEKPQETKIEKETETKKEINTKEPAVVAGIVFKDLEIKFPITLKDLAIKMQQKPSLLIKQLMDIKMMVGINNLLDEKAVEYLSTKNGYRLKAALDEEELILAEHRKPDDPATLKPRPPIVTFMGHVDHGKTSLLDAIRKTKIVELEHGGITQHIGAYSVSSENGVITFLDTPGHEAFTAMRARGASVTDIVVLVVAADDGVMPQTREAIDHARAAGVSIIVALNKIDKPQANPDMVKKQLAALDLVPEEWGGKTIVVPVSAKTGQGINELLEMILLESEMLELKANPTRPASGVVIEAKLTKGRGPVATLLVKNGTLYLNDCLVVGLHYAKIRAMFNAQGQRVNEAPPAYPVEILGLSGVPLAGEEFFVVADEKIAKELSAKRQERQRQSQMKSARRISLEDLHEQIKEGKLKELRLIIKADVQGSVEAIKDVLSKLNLTEINIVILHEGVGDINSSDIILAVASDALVLGFNVAPDGPARELIVKEGVDVRTYNVIYELANDIKAAVQGMLEPKLKKVFMGRLEVKKVFRLSRAGTVAGCFVSKGRITRQANVVLKRNGEALFEGGLASLKRFKDDVREVQEGFECGVSLQNFDNLQEGDTIEAYEIQKVMRKI